VTATLAITVLCAGVIGLSVGMLGAGGSILTVPLLGFVAGRPPREAIATSLVAVLITAAVATVTHARAGRVRWRTGLAFGLAGMVAAYGGGRLSAYVPERLLMAMFGATMLAAAAMMLRGRRARVGEADAAPRSTPVIAAQGAAVGSLTGLIGAGGGFIIVPALHVLARLPMHAAVGTSLMVITMNASAALAGHANQAAIDPVLTSAVTGAMIAGSLVGGQLAGRVEPERLRTGFGCFVIAVAVFVLAQQI
jgi:hypothetical protein